MIPACRLIATRQHMLKYDCSSGAQDNPKQMTLDALCRIQRWILANRIWHCDTVGDIEHGSHNMEHGFLLCGNAETIALISLRFSYTGKGFIHFHITDRILHNSQSQWHYCQSRGYRLYTSKDEIRAYTFVTQMLLLLAYGRSSAELANLVRIVMRHFAQHICPTHLATKSV